MANLSLIMKGLVKPVALRVLAGANRAVVLQRNGLIMNVDLGTGALKKLRGAPGLVHNFDVTQDGKRAIVVGNRLGMWQVGLVPTVSTKVLSRRLIASDVFIDQTNQTIYAVENRPLGRLFELTSRTIRLLSNGLPHSQALVRQKASSYTLIASSAGGGQLRILDQQNVVISIIQNLGHPFDLGWRDVAETQLIVTDVANSRVLQVDPANPSQPPVVLFDNIAHLWGAQALDANQLIIGAEDGLWLGDLQPVANTDPVQFDFPSDPLFVAGWTRVSVNISDPSITFDDLEFYIKPEESAALISLSRDNGFDPNKPNIIVTAGWMAGQHTLIAIHTPTGTQVGEVTFEVTDTWLDTKQGPSLAVVGSIESGPSSGTWGGGDFTTPQNSNVVPALGTRNVAVVLVDTSSARYPTGMALTTILNGFRNEMVNGVTVNGQSRSVATYYNEASYGNFSINLVDVVGPIMLPNNWATYFNSQNVDNDGDGITDRVIWNPVDTFSATVIAQIVQLNQNAANAGNPPFLDLRNIDSLILTVRSVPTTLTSTARFVWPRANLGPRTHIIGWTTIAGVPFPLFRAIASVYMPDDWATQPQSGRRWHETVSHELGHNLQLNDQYFQQGTFDSAFQSRIADDNPNQSWELMSWEEDLPLPSAGHRLMLGWLRPAWIKLFNFGVFGPVDETITLHAASAGTPPPGRYAAAEVRIADGRNYYFEYRPTTTGQIIDPNPPAARTIFGSDVTSRGSTPTNRPEILRLRNDSDLDRGEFQTNDDYEEVDTTSPQFPNDFIVDVISTTADAATIRVRYGLDQEPDPALTPWSPNTNWQSPDIEVINARSIADPTFRNIPWEGHDNTVIARVTNRGQIPAQGVHVRFAFKDFTFAGGAETPLGDQTLDVNTGATVTFTAPILWRPQQLTLPVPFFPQIQYAQHACLVARIDPYINGAIVEVTPDNNEAQSNYTWTATTTASPSTRQAMVLMAENPLSAPAYVSFEIHQPNPLFRVYLSHRWLYLEPNAKLPVLVMIESLFGDPKLSQYLAEFHHRDERNRIFTNVRLTALGDTGGACAPSILGGASILTIAGRATRFEHFSANEYMAEGYIVTEDRQEEVNGQVLVSVRPKDRDDDLQERNYTVEVRNGQFRTEIRAYDGAIVQGHYLGYANFAPCDSKELRV